MTTHQSTRDDRKGAPVTISRSEIALWAIAAALWVYVLFGADLL